MIGIDLIYIPEFDRQLKLGGEAMLERAFLPDERNRHDIEHLAGIWAAKEAVIKALFMQAGDWLKISITYDHNGRPNATAGGQSVEISISHHGEYAVAVALAK